MVDVSPKDRQKIREANKLTIFALKVFRLCVKMGIPVSIENPHSSRLWKLPAVQFFQQLSRVRYSYTDFCMDGRPWRKRTGILIAHYSPDFVKQCFGNTGICQRTGSRHQILEGKNSKGQFWTQVAEKYPPSLCWRWASAIIRALGSRWVRNVERSYAHGT